MLLDFAFFNVVVSFVLVCVVNAVGGLVANYKHFVIFSCFGHKIKILS